VSVIVLAAAAVAFVSAGAWAASGDVIFADDFESYALGAHPTPWDEIYGRDDDVVTDEWAAGGLQSFVSVSDEGLLPRRPLVDLDEAGLLPLPDYLTYECAVYIEADPESSAAVGFVFVDPRDPGHTELTNAVAFRLDGKIMWYGRTAEQLGLWTPGRAQAFTVKVEINYRCGKAAVMINGRDAGTGHPAWGTTIPAESVYGAEIALDKWGFGPAHSFRGDGTARAFIDDVSIRESDFVCCDAGQVKIRPRTINLKSRGRYITVIIELPEPLDSRDIDISTLRMAVPGSVRIAALEKPTACRDIDGDGLYELMVKFPRQEVHEILEVGDEVEIFVGGETTGGEPFAGSDVVKVICPGKPKNNQNQNTTKYSYDYEYMYGQE